MQIKEILSLSVCLIPSLSPPSPSPPHLPVKQRGDNLKEHNLYL